MWKNIFTSDRQYGFWPNQGTIDAIFIVRKFMQKSKERRIKCHYHFADFKSTFDTIWWIALWKMMRSIGICNKIVNIIEKMHEKATCAVAVDGILTGWFSVSVGVRQGLLSPSLFNLFLDFVMRYWNACRNVSPLIRNWTAVQDMQMILP